MQLTLTSVGNPVGQLEISDFRASIEHLMHAISVVDRDGRFLVPRYLGEVGGQFCGLPQTDLTGILLRARVATLRLYFVVTPL